MRLLRQPRYLAASLAGAVYFAWVLSHSLFRRFYGFGGGRGAGPSSAEIGQYDAAIHLGLGFALAAAMTVAWLLVSSKPALRLNETEIDFLLPAPLPRRQIILYSLLGQQPGLLTSTLVIFLVRGGSRAGGRTLLGLLALWAFLTLVDLHLKGISLWKARLREIPAGAAVLRRGLAIALAALWWIALLAALSAAWGAVSRQADPQALAAALARAVDGGSAGKLLAPFVWITTPVSGAVLPPLAGLLLLLAAVALHVVWVVSSRASFEEATLERARRAGARKGVSRQELRARRSRQNEPFRLAPAGPPEAAILWKNLMLRGRTPLSRLVKLLAGTVVAAAAATALFGEVAAAIVTVTGLGLLCGIPLIAGLILRNDLRTDLLFLDVLRTWPIPARRLVLAELLAPATNAFLALLLGCGLVAAAAVGGGLGRVRLLPAAVFGGFPPLLALPVLLACALVTGMAVALLSLAVQNLAVLLLPSWVGLGLSTRRGTAILGQRILVGVGHLLAMTVAALPTLVVVAAVVALHVVFKAPFHLWELPMLTGVAALLLGLKVALLVRLAGTVWERMDPSQEMLTAAENE
jgi:hypothetical protein